MMKKRNVAVAMAAVTFAGTAAPLVAQAAESTVVKKEIFTKAEKVKLTSEIRRLADIEFASAEKNDDLEGQSVYTIKTDISGGTTLEAQTADDKKAAVNDLISEILEAEDKVVVTITDKGHSKDRKGNIVSKAIRKYEKASDLGDLKAKLEAYKEDITVPADTEFTATVESVKVVSNKLTVTLKEKDNVSGQKVDVSVSLGDERINEDTIELEKQDNGTYSFVKEGLVDIEDKKLAEITIMDVQTEEAKIADLYDGYRLTAKGNEVVNGLDVDATVSSTADEKTKLYTLSARYTTEKGVEKELRVTSKVKNELDKLAGVINDPSNRIVQTVAGNTRYTTAVQVANNLSQVDNIVLVNSSAIVDGLAATPFAKATNSAILLTDTNAIPQATLDYVTNHIANNPTAKVYLVGGDSVISKTVETKLSKLTNEENVVRLGGNNRHETSVAVAEEMAKQVNSTRAFVVGATGEADAMSIAAYAAQEEAPIIVNGFGKLSDKAIELLDGANIDVIGGKTAVAEDVIAELAKIDADEKVERTEGKTRFETNANVIEKFYGKTKIENMFIAKDGMAKKDQLVDALTAGPLAAEAEAPILLATDKLSERQEEVVSDKVKLGADLTQLGGGVQLTVIQKLVKMLGL